MENINFNRIDKQVALSKMIDLRNQIQKDFVLRNNHITDASGLTGKFLSDKEDVNNQIKALDERLLKLAAELNCRIFTTITIGVDKYL